jgi:hypothetical protein
LEDTRRKFDDLIWVHKADKSRIWCTGYIPNCVSFGPKDSSPRPVLLLNPRETGSCIEWIEAPEPEVARHLGNQNHGRYHPLAEEEEEDEDEANN